MNIAVMTVNGLEFHPNGRLKQEADARGHDLRLINPYTMACSLETGAADLFFESVTEPQGPKTGFRPQLVLPRQGSPMGEYGFVLLNHFAAMGITLVNGIRGVAIARNQFLTLQCLARAGLPVPDSCFAVSRENVHESVARLGGYPLVAKAVDGMGGDGVVRLDSRQGAEDFLASRFQPRKGLVIQTYIPTLGRKDMRLLVIGDQVAGAMTLTPAQGSFKSNFHQQGQAAPLTPAPALAAMAVAAARACRLSVAGVDMMQDAQGKVWINEVNYSPGFRGLEQATGLNIAGMILDHAINRVKDADT